MTVSTQDNQVTQQTQQNNDRETNFRKQEQALTAKYERELAQERAARQEAERRYQESTAPKISNDDEDDSSEPYVDHKRLRKEQAKFGQQLKQETQSDIQKAVQTALQEERKQNWLKQNSDFFDVLQHADKFAHHDPELAETILTMPEGFERQKLVYKNIKALGLHREAVKPPSIQEKIDANRRSPYYQPSGVATSPHSVTGDFSQSGQKNAYDKMKQLQSQLRL